MSKRIHTPFKKIKNVMTPKIDIHEETPTRNTKKTKKTSIETMEVDEVNISN